MYIIIINAEVKDEKKQRDFIHLPANSPDEDTYKRIDLIADTVKREIESLLEKELTGIEIIIKSLSQKKP